MSLTTAAATTIRARSSLLQKILKPSSFVAITHQHDNLQNMMPGTNTINQHQQQQIRYHHPDPFNPKNTKGWAAAVKEATIPTTKFDQEIQHGLELGLPGASSIDDKTIPTFSRGELPHFAGINTFLKAPYIEDSRKVGEYDAAVVGVPFDGGCTYRPGTRFGPQGIRRISALYTPYNYEKGIDLREQMVSSFIFFCNLRYISCVH